MKVSIYTDGAARGNPDGPGGYGTVMEYVDSKGEMHTKELSQGYEKTTNNRMELMAVIAGLVIDKFRNRGVQLAGMIGATALCYAFGTAWFCFQAESDLLPALTMCVFPFIPGDLVKMVVAIAVGPMLRNRLKKAGLQPEG